MAKSKKWIHTLRNTLVILSTVLMIAVVVFQCMEITTYGIWDHVKTTLKSLFQSAPAPAAPAAPAADATTPAANTDAPPAN